MKYNTKFLVYAYHVRVGFFLKLYKYVLIVTEAHSGVNTHLSDPTHKLGPKVVGGCSLVRLQYVMTLKIPGPRPLYRHWCKPWNAERRPGKLTFKKRQY